METTSNLSSHPWQTSHLSRLPQRRKRGTLYSKRGSATNHSFQLAGSLTPQQVVLPQRTGLFPSMLQQLNPQARSPTLSYMHVPCVQHSTHTPETPSCSRAGCSEAASATHVSMCLASTLAVHGHDCTQSSPQPPWELCMQLTVTMEKNNKSPLFPGQCGWGDMGHEFLPSGFHQS